MWAKEDGQGLSELVFVTDFKHIAAVQTQLAVPSLDGMLASFQRAFKNLSEVLAQVLI